MYGFGSSSIAATASTAAAPRAFSPSNPIARTFTAGDRSAVMSPSIVVGVERRDLRDEALRRDPVNRSGHRLVQVLMPADARIDPVADVQRAVRADRDVRRPEQRLDRAFAPSASPPMKSDPGVLLLRVRGHEDLAAAEIEARAVAHRTIGKDLVAPGLGRRRTCLPTPVAERAVLVEDIAASAIRRRRRRPPASMPGSSCRHSAIGTVCPGRRSACHVRCPSSDENPKFAYSITQRDAACRRIVVVVLEDVAERGDRLLVAVAVVVSDDLGVGAIGIHPHREPADVHVPVVAGLAGMVGVVVREL